MAETFTIESVWIVLTYKNGIEENFKLKKPRGFEFRFDKIPRLPDYRDSYKRWQRGNHFYQFVATYRYEWHEMDLRKLLVADNIELKFPPVFGQTSKYQSVDVILRNESVPRNWVGGMVVGSAQGEVVPQGSVTLEFEGVDAFSEAQVIDNFFWRQRDSDYDVDDDDDDEEPDFSSDTYYLLGIEQGESNSNDQGRIRRIVFDENGDIQYQSDFNFSSESLYLSTNIQSRNISVGKDGTILINTFDSSTGTIYAYVFDEDLNYLNSVSMSDGMNPTNYRPQIAYFGENSNIYIAQGQPDQIRIRKYDSGLNHVWDSEWFDTVDPDGNNDTPEGRAFVFFNGMAILFASQNSNSYDTWLISVDASNGSTNNQVNIDSPDNLRDGYPILCRFSQDNFIVGLHNGFFAVEQVKVYGKNLNEVRTVDLSTIGDLMIGSGSISAEARHSYIATLDENVIVGNPRTDRVKCFNPMTDALVWNSALNNPIYRMSHVSGGKVFTGCREFGEDVEGIALLDSETGSIEFARGGVGDQIYTETEIEPNRAAPVMRYEGWELDYFDESDQPPTPPPTDEYQGSIQITSAAQSDDPGIAPSGEIIVRNAPSEASTPCEEEGGSKFNIEVELTDYCFQLPASTKSNVATAVAGFVSSIDDLGTGASTSFDGDPSVVVTSDNAGEADNGKRIIFGVPSVLEGNGPVFNKYEIFLSGGVDPVTINTPTEIYIGGVLFATTDAIVSDETGTSIAEKIYDACVAVDQSQIEFTRDGDTVTADSEIQQDLTIELDIGNAGYTYTIQDIVKV